jgi:hypothetical protein
VVLLPLLHYRPGGAMYGASDEMMVMPVNNALAGVEAGGVEAKADLAAKRLQRRRKRPPTLNFTAAYPHQVRILPKSRATHLFHLFDLLAFFLLISYVYVRMQSREWQGVCGTAWQSRAG